MIASIVSPHAAGTIDQRTQHARGTSALDRPIVITRATAYDRRAGERTLTFEPAGAGRMRDRETGSSWSLETGEAIGGPLQGERLTWISAKTVYRDRVSRAMCS